MDASLAFLVYAGLYRIAIVAVGALSIWLGYRLFAVLGPDAHGGSTEAEASFGGWRIGVRRAAPGTCFALFGAGLITVTLIQEPPSYRSERSATPEARAETLALKGVQPPPPDAAGDGEGADPAGSAFARTVESADALRAAGADAAAAQTYRHSLTFPYASLAAAAHPLHQLAELAVEAGDRGRAAALAELALGLDPDNRAYRETLARARPPNTKTRDGAAGRPAGPDG
jgi:hypothetical protein